MAAPGVSQLKKTAKHSAIYGIGTALRRITGFIMLPIYTRYLTPADYGVVELLTMAITFVSIFIGLRISQAMFRYYILAESQDEKRLTASTVLLTILGSSSIGMVLMYMSSDSLANALFGNTKYLFELQLFTLTLMFGAVADVGMSYVRARQKPALFVSIGMLTLALQVILNVIFVVVMELHVRGVVYSALVSGLVVAIGISVYVFSQVGFGYSRVIVVKLVKFIAPLIVASVGAFYVTSADKYFLRVFGGLADVGLYALAWRLASVMATVFESFHMTWGADRFEIVKKQNAREFYNQVFRFLGAALFLIGSGLALFANDLLQVMTDPKFYPAGGLVPILVLATIIRVITGFCNFGIIYSERTRHIAEAMWIKALAATIGYVALIPYWGPVGAAIAVTIANVFAFAWTYKKSTALYDMGLSWGPVSSMGLIAVLSVVIGALLPVGEMEYFAARVVIYLVMVYLFYRIPSWTEEEKNMMQLPIRKLTGLMVK